MVEPVGGSDYCRAVEVLLGRAEDVLGPRAGRPLAARLEAVLRRAADGAARDAELEAVVDEHATATAFVEAVLADAPRFRAPDLQSEPVRGVTYQGLPGAPGPITADRFRCPTAGCGFEWVRPALGHRVPPCPSHGAALGRV
ncbi:hypothetical protein [Kineococcus sp. SYSU DK001]|uniref:hypothetical protein n=1 Tax=Kineococcus sp. SYSU DK001 TaxID=3383122 RepID=UPI003D7E6E0D